MPDQSATRHRLVMARVTRRLIPFAFLCYVVAYIDRVNIGFAKDELQRDLGLSNTEFGFGAGLFFLGYCLFEIPSNLILERVGARRWIARIMIGWGLASMATMFVFEETSFYVARVVLGVAEAGFFPGMVLYLTYWVPASDRARINALFMMAAPVAIIVGAPISEALLKLDGWLGLAAGSGCSSSKGCRPSCSASSRCGSSPTVRSRPRGCRRRTGNGSRRPWRRSTRDAAPPAMPRSCARSPADACGCCAPCIS